MTLIEAQCKLEALLADRSICVGTKLWSHYQRPGERSREMEIAISVLPGRNCECSQFTGKTVRQAFEQAVAFLSRANEAEEESEPLVISAEVAELETLPI